MVKRGSDGKRSVPQIFINNIHVGGSDALDQLEATGKLNSLLAQAQLVNC